LRLAESYRCFPFKGTSRVTFERLKHLDDLAYRGPVTLVEPAQPAEAPTGARRTADITGVDLTKPQSFSDGVPYAAFDALREAGGIAWHSEPPVDPDLHRGFIRFIDSPGFWAVTNHSLVTEVLRDQRRFSSELGTTTLQTLAPESLPILRSMMLNMDPPQHTRLRRILQPSFSPRAITRIRDAVVQNARQIIDELGDAESCELVSSVSAELPLRVLADLLGMPSEDRHLIFQWSNALIAADASDEPDGAGVGVDAMSAAIAYGQEMTAARRAEPQEDIVSLIANAEIDGDRLTDTELSMFWILLIVAGNETTRNALSGSVIALLEHDRWSWLANHPEHLSSAIEELLRYVSPVMHFRRTATEEIVLGDQTLRAGDKVVVWYGAANRDPDVFSDPRGIDLLRHPNPHLAFGNGPHFCLGAHLARLEISAMLSELLKRAPDMELAGEPTRVVSNFINGISSLPVRLGRSA
jgi:cytochrome P450